MLRPSQLILYLIILLMLATPILAGAGNSEKYPVLRVVDGDTIVVLYQGKPQKVRMLNVDTPESVHPNPSRNSTLGKKASEYTRSRLAGKQVSLEFEGIKKGKYGRLLAYVILDNENFNLELVKKGWSPYYTKYGNSPSYHQGFTAAQSLARSRQINIWEPSLRDNIQPAPQSDPARVAGLIKLHGNSKSRIFHNSTCRYFQCKNCTQPFSSRKAALRAGFSPCGICRP